MLLFSTLLLLLKGAINQHVPLVLALAKGDLVLLAGPVLNWAVAEGRAQHRTTFHSHTQLLNLAPLQLTSGHFQG